ncbi:MAG: LPS-assembly protein LptD [Betaproteobacteria bacterium]|nr:LPS-assembly protein LptD [Betaproteobacteria bacterium]
MDRRCLPIALACALACPAGAADGVTLKLDRLLRPTPPKLQRDLVKFLSADRVTGDENRNISATGGVMMRQRGVAIRADRLDYTTATDTAVAVGNVTLEREADTVTGPRLLYRLGEQTGEMESPVFEIAKTPERRTAARGSASKVLLEGDEQSRLFDAQYTSCPVPRDDWKLSVGELLLDSRNQEGTAHNATVTFFGVPILYSPWLSFPLDNRRRTGFLAPTLGSSGRGGFEFSLPWYWNIAPNHDATITPKLFSKRGLQVGAEYRYLKPDWTGQADVEFLPNDSIADQNRWLLGLKHNHKLPLGWNLALNAQRVSDDNYFRDLSTRVSATSQTNLPRDVIVGTGDENWAFSARAIAYQTLQDPEAPVVVPYRQVPQLLWSGFRQDVRGADLQGVGEFTNYRHPDLVNGQRLIVYPQASYPIRRPWGYVTPKAGVHLTRYNMTDNEQGFADTSRTVPMASVDAGLFFDRATSLGGRDFVQTLEPRLFYLNVPFREQSNLPVFSTDEVDFGASSLFRENRFIGGDRIGDANQLTAAVSSRLIESGTGLERLQATLGQIYYFDPQRVTLPGRAPRDDNKSDLVAIVTGQVTPAFSMDAGVEYNASANRSRRFDLAARYAPQPGRVLNVAYRFARDDPERPGIKQVDFSAQWPLFAGLTGVARWNWSLKDKKLIEGLAGFEYNAGCWEIRAVAHRFITATEQVSTSFQVQLELSGLSRIGINPLETLRQNISGYRRSDEISR